MESFFLLSIPYRSLVVQINLHSVYKSKCTTMFKIFAHFSMQRWDPSDDSLASTLSLHTSFSPLTFSKKCSFPIRPVHGSGGNRSHSGRLPRGFARSSPSTQERRARDGHPYHPTATNYFGAREPAHLTYHHPSSSPRRNVNHYHAIRYYETKHPRTSIILEK